MKKLTFVIIGLLFFLTGCSIFVLEEDSEAYRLLSKQYTEFQLNDLADIKNFQAFINEVTLESSVASVMVEVKIYSRLGALIETRHGSGVIFHEDSQNYHVLTDARLVELSGGQSQVIEISDYLGRTYRGYLQRTSDSGLAGIRFSKVTNRTLKVLSIADENPMIGEPVLLIGYQRQIINALTMGLVLEQQETMDQNYLKTSIISDNFGNGGVIMNTLHQIVGIQVQAEMDYMYAINIEDIRAFYDVYST